MNIQLIKAAVGDAEKLLEIQKICFAPHLQRYQDYETNPAMVSIDIIRWQIENENFYKIFADDIWVGSINLRKIDEETYKLHIINILPEYQGKGIGQAAIFASEKLFPHVKTWHLDTLEDMPQNRHVYEKVGYAFTGETQVINEKLTLVFYRKDVIFP